MRIRLCIGPKLATKRWVGSSDWSDATVKSLYTSIGKRLILCRIENCEFSISKLNNPVPNFGFLRADNDVGTLDVSWTSHSDRLAITFSRHDARMVRLVGNVGLCVPNWNGPCAQKLAFVRPATAGENRNDD